MIHSYNRTPSMFLPKLSFCRETRLSFFEGIQNSVTVLKCKVCILGVLLIFEEDFERTLSLKSH